MSNSKQTGQNRRILRPYDQAFSKKYPLGVSPADLMEEIFNDNEDFVNVIGDDWED